MTIIIVVVGGRSAVRFMTSRVRLRKKRTMAAPSAADQAALGLEKSPTTTQTRPATDVGSSEPRRSCAKASDCDASRAGVALKENLPGASRGVVRAGLGLIPIELGSVVLTRDSGTRGGLLRLPSGACE